MIVMNLFILFVVVVEEEVEGMERLCSLVNWERWRESWCDEGRCCVGSVRGGMSEFDRFVF